MYIALACVELCMDCIVEVFSLEELKTTSNSKLKWRIKWPPSGKISKLLDSVADNNNGVADSSVPIDTRVVTMARTL